MKEIVLKILDWPCLLFVGVGILIYNYKSEFAKVISRGGINLTWGDKSFEISELPNQLNENFATVSDDIDDLKAKIKELETVINNSPTNVSEDKPSELNEEQVEAARERMLKGLESGKYTWRSIERLAAIGNVTEAQASNILRKMDEVVFSRGKSERTIVKLADR